MKMATRQVAAQSRSELWVEAYEHAHPEAGRWASGSGIPHTVETRERVYRMVEQIRHRQEWSAGEPIFGVLEAADEVAQRATEALPGSVSPVAAATAGLFAYRAIFAGGVAVGPHGWPRDLDVAEAGEADLVMRGLRAGGFDPIVFDGTDPAAHTWALFELRERQAEAHEAVRAGARVCPRPCALAIVPAAPVQTPASSEKRLEAAGVGM